MTKLWICVFLGLLFSVGGCSLAPQFQQPEAPVPALWPQGEAYPQEWAATKLPTARELNWEDFFTDPHLQEIIAKALANSRDLQLAVLDVQRAQALYGVQRAEQFPALDAVGAASKQRIPADLSSSGRSMTTKEYSVNFGIVSWEMDFFGRIRNLKDQALQEYLATDEARRSTQIALVAEIARTYLTMAADQEALNLAVSTLTAQQGTYDLIDQRLQTGLGTKLDLRRAQTQVDTAREDVAFFTQAIARDSNALTLLVGAQVDKALLPKGLGEAAPFQDVSPGLPSVTLLSRPDIIAAEHRLRAAYAYIGSARAAFFPRITLTATGGTASNELSGLFDGGQGSWNFTPQFSLPIFDARTQAVYRVSQVERDIALARYEQIIQRAFKNVADALAVRGTIDKQLNAHLCLVEAATETYSLSSGRYSEGIDNYLSVLDAQRSLYSAQQGLVQLQLSKLVNRVDLYAELGGGG